MLKLKLIRLNLKETYTEGVLINLNTNKEIFDTLEDKVRDINADGDLLDEGEEKIYAETAIPYGTYEIEVTYSPKFKKPMVLVKDVKHFKGIRLHWGRTAKQSAGCILGGDKSSPGELKNTGYTEYMVTLLESHGNKGTLEIV